MGCGSSQADGQDGGGIKAKRKTVMDKQIENYNYPPPVPPKTKKADVFKQQEFKALDKYASTLPDDILYGSFEEITQYLTKDTTTDIQKARVLFIWVTSIDIATLQSELEHLPEEGTPLHYLLQIHWKMGNHAHLYAKLCRAADLACVIVTGCNKSAAYQVGGKVSKKAMAAQWTCAHLDGEWRFIDTMWASTCVEGKRTGEWNLIDLDGEITDEEETQDDGEAKHLVNEAYFLTDPEVLITTHLPDGPDWQLLDKPISLETFEKNVYIRERFFDMGLQLVSESHNFCVVKSENGEIQFSFGFHTGTDTRKSQFRYTMFRARKATDHLPEDIQFERFVLFQKKKDCIYFKCRFPITGKYKIDIFGQEEGEHSTFDLCCSYLIECDVAKKDCEPYPDCPNDGWGPSSEAEAIGFVPLSHEDPIITSKNGMVEIKFKTDGPMDILHSLKSENKDEWDLMKNSVMKKDGDEVTLSLRLPEKGQYALNINAAKSGHKGPLPNVCNYIIDVESNNASLKPFPKIHDNTLGKGKPAKELKVEPINEKDDTIKTDNGKFKAEFKHSKDTEIYCEVNNNDLDRKHIAEGVKVTSKQTSSEVEVELPLLGEYGMNVYAKTKGNDCQLHHVQSYIVNSTQSEKSEMKLSKGELPIIPSVSTSDSILVPMPPRKNPVLAEYKTKGESPCVSNAQVKSKKGRDQDLLHVKLPKEGEYMVDAFEKKESGALENVCIYHILRNDELSAETLKKEAEADASKQSQQQAKPEKDLTPEEREQRQKQKEMEEFWKEQRKQLKAAIGSQDPATIGAAIKEFEQHQVPDDKGLLKKAKNLKDFLVVSNDLTESMASRNLGKLEKAVETAEKKGFSKKLGLQLKMAVQVRDHLRHLEKLRHAILDLDQKTIAEIKSYSKPPEGIHKVMVATFLLLGNTEKQLKEWPAVVVLIGKTGKESLKRRITVDFQVDKLKMEVAQKAKQKIQEYELDFIRDLSAGAATFYVWVTGMVEECEARYKQGGGDIDLVKPNKSKKGKAKKKK